MLVPSSRPGVGRSIVLVGSLACFGYLLGTVRDALIATFYGGSPALDAYFVALAPAQFLATEGASLVYLAFLPEFVQALRHADGSYGHLLRTRLAFGACAGGAVAGVLAMVGVVVPQSLAPGYAAHGALGALRWSVVILSLLIPGLGILGVLRASLEARARFSVWALLPGFRSTVLIACVLMSASHPGVGWLLAGNVIGVALIIGYGLVTAGEHAPEILSPATGPTPPPRALPSSLTPLVVAIVLGTLTTVVDNAFASRAGVGGVQSLALALNLLAAPQNIIGGVVATVFFPVYGRLWVDGHTRDAFASLARSIRLVVFGLLPIVAILVTAGIVVVRVVYRHGSFTEDLAVTVSHTVAALALGQVFYATSVLLRQFLLVAGAQWAVCEAAAIFLLVKWVGNTVLIARLGVPGVALASSAAAVCTCAFLVVRTFRIAGRMGGVSA